MTTLCAPVDPLRLPKSLRKVARGLLDQQLWNFGCDVRGASHNHLLAYGFERYRPERAGEGTSCYALPLDGGRLQLVVWGFGIYVGCMHHGLFVRRFKFAPAQAFTERPVVGLFTPRSLRLSTVTQQDGDGQRHRLYLLLQSLCEYERWVITTFGVPYRDDCLRQRSHLKANAITKPQQVPEVWASLAQEFAPRSAL